MAVRKLRTLAMPIVLVIGLLGLSMGRPASVVALTSWPLMCAPGGLTSQQLIQVIRSQGQQATTVQVGHTVTCGMLPLCDSNCLVPGLYICSVQIDMGDGGAPNTTVSAMHSYSQPGSYHLTGSIVVSSNDAPQQQTFTASTTVTVVSADSSSAGSSASGGQVLGASTSASSQETQLCDSTDPLGLFQCAQKIFGVLPDNPDDLQAALESIGGFLNSYYQTTGYVENADELAGLLNGTTKAFSFVSNVLTLEQYNAYISGKLTNRQIGSIALNVLIPDITIGCPVEVGPYCLVGSPISISDWIKNWFLDGMPDPNGHWQGLVPQLPDR